MLESQFDERGIFSPKCERAVLVGIQMPKETEESANEHLRELESLVETMGIPRVQSCLIKVRKVDSRYFIGSGKVEELRHVQDETEADIFIFDTDLSPSQQRNLERDLENTVIDREEVILDIFSDRAHTREAVLQVELARMEYSLPRLTRAWTHFSRQRGGAKGNRGKGETQLEQDRRGVLKNMSSLKKELQQVQKTRETQRKKRRETPVPTLSLVGYTNAGKSSVLNMMSHANVLAEDKLFATLDPTSRRIHLPAGREFILSDTVGFIRKLPHHLIDAFKSTLEETVLADAILHVLDGSNPLWREHFKTTMTILEELGAGSTPTAILFNKADKMENQLELRQELLKYAEERSLPVVFLSAKTQEGKNDLQEMIGSLLSISEERFTLMIPNDKWDIYSYVRKNGLIHEEEFEESFIRLEISLSEKDQRLLAEYRVDS